MLSRFISIFQRISPTGLSVVLFLPLLLFGILNYPDYGLAWDEHTQHEIGMVSYNYLVHGDDVLLNYLDKDYGVAFELPLIFLEKIFGLEDTRSIYQMRHLVAHLFFLFCLFCGYWLIYRLFKNQWLAAFGVLLIALHPILYAHSFFNTKDIPFMGMYLVCFFLIQRIFEKYSFTHIFLAGMAIGLLVNLRIMGVLLFVFVLFFAIVDLIKSSGTERRHIIRGIMLFLLGFWVALYFSWPFLYDNPFEKIALVFTNMSKFRWHSSVLYFGEMIKATELPWHYALVWFGITTPLVYVILGIVGVGLTLFDLLRSPLKVLDRGLHRNLAIFAVSLIAPVLAVIVLKSVIYDGWRHLYFIYPPFVLLLLYGIHKIKDQKKRRAIFAVVGIAFIAIVPFMANNHPHQNVFFNALINRSTPEHERKLFELDYWGTSYRQGLEEILRQDSSAQISVNPWKPPGVRNLLILPKKDRERIEITDDNPKYFITAYRHHPEDYSYDATQEIFTVKVQNNKILSVFQLRD